MSITASTGAISVAEHAGWAHLICVAAIDRVPAVIERRRVATIDGGLPAQPYHHESLGMEEDEANALVACVRHAVVARTSHALQQAVSDLAPAYAIVALAIRESPFPELPDTVTEVWKSYRLQSCADGMLYQLAMCRAARDLDLEVHVYPRRGAVEWATEQLGIAPGAIDSFVSGTGRPPGPPWTQEHRRAFAAGIAALARHTRGRLTVVSE